MIALLTPFTSSIAYAADDKDVAAAASYSTSAIAEPQEPATPNTPPAPERLPVVSSEKQGKAAKPEKVEKPGVRPFTHPAIAVKVGILNGAGFDVALPLSRKFNIRGGASFFSFDHTFTSDGTNYYANMKLQSSNVSIDWFPFGNAFRMSAIGQVYNNNYMTANASVPGGQSFTLNNVDYYSAAGDPIGGTALLTLGNQGGSTMAPGFTIGFGNMIPRGKGQHWSVPFEIGFIYIQQPQITLNLNGIACQTQADANAQHSTTPNIGSTCAYIATDPTTQMNVLDEQNDLNNDLSPLRFYPILSVGLSYKF